MSLAAFPTPRPPRHARRLPVFWYHHLMHHCPPHPLLDGVFSTGHVEPLLWRNLNKTNNYLGMWQNTPTNCPPLFFFAYRPPWHLSFSFFFYAQPTHVTTTTTRQQRCGKGWAKEEQARFFFVLF
ncbi:hypothetical protein, unlikely [Trypanosoma congolense IL3000]|uniref:Uncharacterized protein n=1 Tax=Trypanosoma congolense (strain IL3000) TaxID=1068625 RepID=F9W6C5_TRYCI|nr:hypothetical protein, unlikely [Trypanosoma congolense IL3000]